MLREAFQLGLKDFGENKVQEMAQKHEELPKGIKWHQIGHLQTNKVKYIAPFVTLIHSVDSFKLLKEINKRGKENGRIIDCLLQVYIAQEETKYGLDFNETTAILESEELADMAHVCIKGLMGMASFTRDEAQLRQEFSGLRTFFEQCRQRFATQNINIQELSMGMSGDYLIAAQQGSTMVRVGSALFGERNYSK